MPRVSQRVLATTAAVAAFDPALAALVDKVGPCDIGRGRPRRDHFGELTRAILFQQLAGKAAAAIHARFAELFAGDVTPENVLAAPETALRGAGLSGAKAAAVRDLAQKCVDGTVRLDRLARLPDDEIVRELVTVRGIGRWTSEMFLIFQLRRPDVWPVDDYGVRKGYALLFGLDEMPAPKALQPLGDRFRPHRSAVAWYCWRAVDTVLPDGTR